MVPVVELPDVLPEEEAGADAVEDPEAPPEAAGTEALTDPDALPVAEAALDAGAEALPPVVVADGASPVAVASEVAEVVVLALEVLLMSSSSSSARTISLGKDLCATFPDAALARFGRARYAPSSERSKTWTLRGTASAVDTISDTVTMVENEKYIIRNFAQQMKDRSKTDCV